MYVKMIKLARLKIRFRFRGILKISISGLEIFKISLRYIINLKYVALIYQCLDENSIEFIDSLK